MANLAIRGHKTRGKEVIEILEMLGGTNKYEISDAKVDLLYTIRSHDKFIIGVYPTNTFIVFTLEEFYEKFQYRLNELVLCDDGLLGVITKMEWDCEKSDMKYHISFNTHIYNKWYNSKNIKYKLAKKDMTNLAIRGNINNLGWKVIKTLEMLGGVNKFNLDGNTDAWYVLDESRTIRWCELIFEEKGFTLEEFFEKFPYKIGDRVRVPEYESEVCISKMRWDGWEVQYEVITDDPDEAEWYSAKELNEYNEPNEPNKEKKINQMSLANCDLDEVEIVLGDNFELKIREGKYYAIRKKILYPKTYGECCKILGCKANDFFTNFSYNGCDVEISDYENKIDDLLQTFRKLIDCRNAYWKLYGERMGLGEPWEPDWRNGDETKFCIYTTQNIISLDLFGVDNKILAFPTEEMRDAFLENFGYLIELCKELL